jgi:LAO/AO transport system kinase
LKATDKVQAYLEGIRKGDIAVLSRAITLIESNKPEHRDMAASLIDSILPFTGKSLRIGITGSPGVGKSTFIESFGLYLISLGKKVAVLAIDPSSSVSKGSILGDKTRMEKLSTNREAFIRPSASGGSLGGITYKTRETILLCEAAGFDTILIETVGVGQSETEVSHMTDFLLLLMLAGAGDELQGMKRGIMEMADGMVITKADGPNLAKAKLARGEYARALHFLPPQPSGWRPEVLIASAYDGSGIKETFASIEKYVQLQRSKGYFQQKRAGQNLYSFQRLLAEKMRQLLLQDTARQKKVSQLEEAVETGKISPYTAIKDLFD